MNQDKTPWLKFYTQGECDIAYPDTSLYRMVLQSAEARPDHIACEYFGARIPYKTLVEHIDQCALAFSAIGVKAGDAVSICMPNTPEAIYAFYALNKLGAVANMVHPLSAENEIKYYLNESMSRVVVTIDIALEKINALRGNVHLDTIIVVSPKDSMDALMKLGYGLTRELGRKKPRQGRGVVSFAAFMQLARQAVIPVQDTQKGSACGAILYSGGTTGYPKGIRLSNANFNAVALQSIAAIGTLSSQDRVLALMPIFHGFGLGICIHTTLCFGGTAIVLPQFSAKTFPKIIAKYKPTVIAGVPTLYEALLRNPKANALNLNYLNAVISGGDSLSVNLKKKIDAFLAAHGSSAVVREGYGLTECVTGSCVTPRQKHKEGSIGVPYPGMAYKVIQPGAQTSLPWGQEGEIAISGPSVMLGYLNDEAATNRVLQRHADGKVWLHTGDLGSMDEEGFVFFKQRIQRMIVSNGYNIYPQYIENVIDQHPDVLMTTVIGIPHEYKRQVAKAFVVLKDNVQVTDALKRELFEICQKNLARVSWPQEIVFRKSLPKTLVGKIAYTELLKEETPDGGNG